MPRVILSSPRWVLTSTTSKSLAHDSASHVSHETRSRESPDERYKAGRADDITAPTNPYSGIANMQQQKARPDPTAPATTSSKHKDQQRHPHIRTHLGTYTEAKPPGSGNKNEPYSRQSFRLPICTTRDRVTRRDEKFRDGSKRVGGGPYGTRVCVTGGRPDPSAVSRGYIIVHTVGH